MSSSGLRQRQSSGVGTSHFEPEVREAPQKQPVPMKLSTLIMIAAVGTLGLYLSWTMTLETDQDLQPHARRALAIGFVLLVQSDQQMYLLESMFSPIVGIFACAPFYEEPAAWPHVHVRASSVASLDRLSKLVATCPNQITFSVAGVDEGPESSQLVGAQELTIKWPHVERIVGVPLGAVIVQPWYDLAERRSIPHENCMDHSKNIFVLSRPLVLDTISLGIKNTNELDVPRVVMRATGPRASSAFVQSVEVNLGIFRDKLMNLRLKQAKRQFQMLVTRGDSTMPFSGWPKSSEVVARTCLSALVESRNLHGFSRRMWQNTSKFDHVGHDQVLRLLRKVEEQFLGKPQDREKLPPSYPSSIGQSEPKEKFAFVIPLQSPSDVKFINALWSSEELGFFPQSAEQGHTVIVVPDIRLWEANWVSEASIPWMHHDFVKVLPRSLSFNLRMGLGEAYAEVIGYLYLLTLGIKFDFAMLVEPNRMPLRYLEEIEYSLHIENQEMGQRETLEYYRRVTRGSYKSRIAPFEQAQGHEADATGMWLNLPTFRLECGGQILVAPDSPRTLVHVLSSTSVFSVSQRTKAIHHSDLHRVFVQGNAETAEFIKQHLSLVQLTNEEWLPTLLSRIFQVGSHFDEVALAAQNSNEVKLTEYQSKRYDATEFAKASKSDAIIFSQKLLEPSPRTVALLSQALRQLRTKHFAWKLRVGSGARTRKFVRPPISCVQSLAGTWNLALNRAMPFDTRVLSEGAMQFSLARSLLPPRPRSTAFKGPLVFVVLIHTPDDLEMIDIVMNSPISPLAGEHFVVIPDTRIYQNKSLTAALDKISQGWGSTISVVSSEHAIAGTWGGFSLVYKELVGYLYALALVPNLSHTVLISGTSAPTSSLKAMRKFLRPGVSYFYSEKIRSGSVEEPRVDLQIWECAGKQFGFSWNRNLLKPSVAKFAKRMWKGGQWKIMAGSHLDRMFRGDLASKLDEYVQILQHTFIMDEHLLPTFLTHHIPPAERVNGTFMGVLWEDGRPLPVTQRSLFSQLYFYSLFFFARKIPSPDDMEAVLELTPQADLLRSMPAWGDCSFVPGGDRPIAKAHCHEDSRLRN